MFNLISFVQATQLNLSRQIDHTYRLLMGVPQLGKSEISPQLFLGGQYSHRGYAILKKRGITGIVSMRLRAREGLVDLREVEFLHLPTPDLHAPSIAHLQKGVAFISRHILAGGKVYVHCAAGEGRGPSMMAAYLMSTGMTLDDALKQIKMVRGFIRPTAPQLERLKQFEAILNQQQ